MNSTEASPAPPKLTQLTLRTVNSGMTLFSLVYFVLMFPFVSVLLKYRVNYVPMRGQTSADGQVEGNTRDDGSETKSYFSMFHKVLEYENWSGMYKGFMPSLVKQLAELSVTLILVFGYDPKADMPTPRFWHQVTWNLFEMLSLPARIIINRAIVTHHRLPWFDSKHALRHLITEEERRRPWLLYFTPGLFMLDLLFNVVTIGLMRPTRSRILSQDTESRFLPRRSFVRICVLLGYTALSTTLNCVFENVFARLSVQRSISEIASSTKAHSDRNVHELHEKNFPYAGPVDCVGRMVKEEGYSAVLHAWWCNYLSWWFILFAL